MERAWRLLGSLACVTAAACGPSPAFEPDVVVVSPPPAGGVRAERAHQVGRITVVDLGGTASLVQELGTNRVQAAAHGDTLLVMTMRGRCEPCAGVDQSLADPLMQAALAKVRLVRVDLDVFGEELAEHGIPTDRIPAFALLSSELGATDVIDGGEWDDDIAPNIAPVLGAFVRGAYTHRRRPARPAGAAPLDF